MTAVPAEMVRMARMVPALVLMVLQARMAILAHKVPQVYQV